MPPFLYPFTRPDGLEVWPTVHPEAFVAPGAVLVGDVTVEAGASVWFNCVLRGDVAPIVIGKGSNIQDGTVIHTASEELNGTARPTVVGQNVTVGHMALLHACTIEGNSLIGMKACIMDGAVVQSGAMVAAGALVGPGKTVSSGELWAGVPAQYKRPLSEEELAYLGRSAACYTTWGKQYSQTLNRLP